MSRERSFPLGMMSSSTRDTVHEPQWDRRDERIHFSPEENSVRLEASLRFMIRHSSQSGQLLQGLFIGKIGRRVEKDEADKFDFRVVLEIVLDRF